MTNFLRSNVVIVFGCVVSILACGRSMKGEFYSLDDGKRNRLVFSTNGTFEIYRNDSLEGIGTYEREGEIIYLTVADDTTRAIYAHDKIAVEPEGKKQDIFVSKEIWAAEHKPPEDG